MSESKHPVSREHHEALVLRYVGRDRDEFFRAVGNEMKLHLSHTRDIPVGAFEIGWCYHHNSLAGSMILSESLLDRLGDEFQNTVCKHHRGWTFEEWLKENIGIIMWNYEVKPNDPRTHVKWGLPKKSWLRENRLFTVLTSLAVLVGFGTFAGITAAAPDSGATAWIISILLFFTAFFPALNSVKWNPRGNHLA